jgi:hypothetical protein
VLDGRLKHRLSPKKTVASIKHTLDLAAVPSPLLDLEVVAVVAISGSSVSFVRLIAHQGAALLSSVNKRIRVRPRLGAEQLGQLGDVRRDPASLVRQDHDGCNYPAPRLYLRTGRVGRGLYGRGA